jgi:hypothetical protein
VPAEDHHHHRPLHRQQHHLTVRHVVVSLDTARVHDAVHWRVIEMAKFAKMIT